MYICTFSLEKKEKKKCQTFTNAIFSMCKLNNENIVLVY